MEYLSVPHSMDGIYPDYIHIVDLERLFPLRDFAGGSWLVKINIWSSSGPAWLDLTWHDLRPFTSAATWWEQTPSVWLVLTQCFRMRLAYWCGRWTLAHPWFYILITPFLLITHACTNLFIHGIAGSVDWVLGAPLEGVRNLVASKGYTLKSECKNAPGQCQEILSSHILGT